MHRLLVSIFGHPLAGGAPLACVPIRALAGSDTLATRSWWHGGPHNGVAPRTARTAVWELGVPGAAHGAYHRSRPTTKAIDRAPYEAVALFRYPARCLTHKCPGQPNMGPLHMALHAPEALPWELDSAVRTHPQEHFRVHATLFPHCSPITCNPVRNQESSSRTCRC